MKPNHIFLITLCLLLWIGASPVLLGQSRSNALEISVGGGTSGMNLKGGIADSVSISGAAGLRIGGTYLLGINDQLGFGFGLGLNRYAISANLDRFATTQSESSHPDIEPSYNSFDQSIVANNVIEQMNISEFTIPVFLDLQFGQGSIRPYSRLGVALTLPSGKYQNTGGDISYEARFEELPRVNSAETFGVTLSDLDKYGFTSGNGISDTELDLVLNSTAFAWNARLGVRAEVSPEMYVYGEGFFSSSTNISAYNLNSYSPTQTASDYQTMMAGASSASVNRIGVNVGVGIILGGERPSKTLQQIDIRYEQKLETRRNPAEADAEFLMLADEILEGLLFKPSSYRVSVNKALGQLQFVGNAGNPEAITVSDKSKSSYMSLDQFDSRFKTVDNVFQLVLSPPNNHSISFRLQDTDTESAVDGFEVEIKVNNQVVIPKTSMNTGNTIYKLYDHPKIQYEVSLTHPCYPDQVFFLTSEDFGTTKLIQAESEGEAEEISVPINAVTSDLIRMQGAILKQGRRTPLSGTLSNGRINLYAGCGESPGTNYQLVLEKPLGYDLYTGADSRGWRQPDLLVAMRNGRPSQPLTLEPIPSYNLFYIDISEAQNRNLIRRPVLERVNDLRDAGHEFFVFLSNGQSPQTASEPKDFRSVLRQLVLSSPDVPTVGLDRQLLLQRMKPEELLPTRRIVNMHFYLSKSLYNNSREQLINELTAAFPEGRENIRIFIHTDFEIPESDKLERGLYRTPIEYIYLR